METKVTLNLHCSEKGIYTKKKVFVVFPNLLSTRLCYFSISSVYLSVKFPGIRKRNVEEAGEPLQSGSVSKPGSAARWEPAQGALELRVISAVLGDWSSLRRCEVSCQGFTERC